MARWRLPHALLAVLAALSLGLAAWAFELRRHNALLAAEVRTARQASSPALLPAPRPVVPSALPPVPQVNVPIVDVFPMQSPRGATPVELTAGLAATLVLNSAATTPERPYRLRIRAHDGNIVWEGSGLRHGSPGKLTLLLPAELARPGEYRLELFATEKRARALETYRLRLRPPPAP